MGGGGGGGSGYGGGCDPHTYRSGTGNALRRQDGPDRCHSLDNQIVSMQLNLKTDQQVSQEEMEVSQRLEALIR